MQRFIMNPPSRKIAVSMPTAMAVRPLKSPTRWVRCGAFNCVGGGWTRRPDFSISNSIIPQSRAIMACHDRTGFIHREVREDKSAGRLVIKITTPD